MPLVSQIRRVALVGAGLASLALVACDTRTPGSGEPGPAADRSGGSGDEVLAEAGIIHRRLLTIEWALATVAHFVDHIDYAVWVAGVDHVGIGSDFDGGGRVTGWSDAGESANVTTELLRRGYTEEEIAKIWGGNLLRVWRENVDGT